MITKKQLNENVITHKKIWRSQILKEKIKKIKLKEGKKPTWVHSNQLAGSATWLWDRDNLVKIKFNKTTKLNFQVTNVKGKN